MKDPFKIDLELNTIFSHLHDACSIHTAIHSLQLNNYLESLGLPADKVSIRKQIIEHTLNAMIDRRDRLIKQSIALIEAYDPNASINREESSSPTQV